MHYVFRHDSQATYFLLREGLEHLQFKSGIAHKAEVVQNNVESYEATDCQNAFPLPGQSQSVHLSKSGEEHDRQHCEETKGLQFISSHQM